VTQPDRGKNQMNDQTDDFEPITYARVRLRLKTLIEVMPKSKTDVYDDKLLKNIRGDLIEIKGALDYLQERAEFHEKRSSKAG
jgi:hypothetical protein